MARLVVVGDDMTLRVYGSGLIGDTMVVVGDDLPSGVFFDEVLITPLAGGDRYLKAWLEETVRPRVLEGGSVVLMTSARECDSSRAKRFRRK